jgi:alpha-tubulin suppressor-like RCC1 family protein
VKHWIILVLLALAGMASAADVQVAAGENHAIFLDAHGRVWAWGTNDAGQLGDGTATASLTTPVQCQYKAGGNLADAIAIAAGGETTTGFSVALRADGTMWTWGSNTYGQLGNNVSGTTESAAIQVQVNGGAAFTSARMIAVSAGRRHVVALRGDGTVWTWGDDTYGQCGQGTSGTAYLGPSKCPG